MFYPIAREYEKVTRWLYICFSFPLNKAYSLFELETSHNPSPHFTIELDARSLVVLDYILKFLPLHKKKQS